MPSRVGWKCFSFRRFIFADGVEIGIESGLKAKLKWLKWESAALFNVFIKLHSFTYSDKYKWRTQIIRQPSAKWWGLLCCSCSLGLSIRCIQQVGHLAMQRFRYCPRCAIIPLFWTRTRALHCRKLNSLTETLCARGGYLPATIYLCKANKKQILISRPWDN